MKESHVFTGITQNRFVHRVPDPGVADGASHRGVRKGKCLVLNNDMQRARPRGYVSECASTLQ